MNAQRTDGATAGANALMILSGFAGIVAGVWLAVDGEWAAALASVLVVILAVGGLVIVAERSRQPGDSANVAPWTATGHPGADEILAGLNLNGREIDQLRAYYAAQYTVAQFPGMRVQAPIPVSEERAAEIREAFMLKYGDRKLPSDLYEPYQGEDGS